MKDTWLPSPLYLNNIVITPAFFFELNLADVFALIPMNLCYSFFNAVGNDGSAATFVPILSLSFLAVRERIFSDESLNVTNLFARRDNFHAGDDGAFLYEPFAVALKSRGKTNSSSSGILSSIKLRG